MRGLTQGRNLIHVSSVANLLRNSVTKNATREFTQTKGPSYGSIVQRRLLVQVINQRMKELTLEKDLTFALFAPKIHRVKGFKKS